MNSNKVKQHTGRMEKIIVYIQGTGVIIGTGYRTWYVDKEGNCKHTMDLIDLKGDNLEEGFYTIQPQADDTLVVINRTVQ